MKKLFSTASLIAALGIAVPALAADAPASAQAPASGATEAKSGCSCGHMRTAQPAAAPSAAKQDDSSRREPGGGH